MTNPESAQTNAKKLEQAQELETFRQKVLEENEKTREDLRALAELLELKIIREAKDITGKQIIVVDNGKGEEVCIGFPDSRKERPCATAKIEGVDMKPYGHGPWSYFIEA